MKAARQEDSGRELQEALPLLSLLILTGLAYINGLNGGFLFDDQLLAQHAWAWKPISEWGWGLPNPLGHAAQRPLVTAVFYLDMFLFGKDATTGYHVINLLLQLLNVWLCWVLAGRLGLSTRAGWIVAAVFAFHPVQTESVVYISGRRDLLHGFFYLTTFLLYLEYREKKPLWWQIALPVYFFIGLGAKESLFTLPGLFLLYEALLAKNPWTDPPEKQQAPSPWKKIAKAFADYKLMYALIFLLGVPLLAHRSFISTHLGYDPTGNLIGGTLGTHVMTALRAQVILLWRLIFPMNLLADYSMDSIAISHAGWSDPLGWAAMIVIVVLIGSIFTNLSRRPWLAFALSIIVLGLLPTAQIIRHREVTAEHYLYLPCIGFGILLAMLDARVRATASLKNAAMIATAGLTVLFSLYIVRCWMRNPDYESAEVFWNAVLEESPHSARALINVGAYEATSGKQYTVQHLLQRFLDAQKYDPHNAGGFANAGLIYKSLAQQEFANGKKDGARALLAKAIESFEEALKYEPRNPDYHIDMARLLLAAERDADAWEHVEWVRQRVPNHARMQALRREVLLRRASEQRVESYIRRKAVERDGDDVLSDSADSGENPPN